ncbi:MAG: hypothetical protein P8Y24_00930 [Gammaproteobacteria bacterium]|jgi:hypothetical protein
MKSLFVLLFTSLALVSVNVQARPDKAKGLPPGLQKKAARGQALPPGWQKKLAVGHVMDKAVYDYGEVVVPVDKKGILTLRVEGKLVRLLSATHEIVEILQ